MDNRLVINEKLYEALRACTCGDQSAFRVIYNLTYPKFKAITQAKVRSPDIADDILQKTYISIWKSCQTYDPDQAKAFTWMLVILRNRTIDVMRSRKHVTHSSELSDVMIDETAQPAQDAQNNILGSYLQKYINRLPEHIGQAVILKVMHGYTSKEISVALAVPHNSVRSWVHRGLKQMQDDIYPETFDTLF